MKRLLTTIILGIWLSGIAGAQNYFNNKATLNNCCVSLNSVVASHDKYFTAGWGVDSINSLGNGYFIGINGVKFSIWDSQGRLIHDTAYQRPDSGSIQIANNAMLELPNHTFIIPADGGDLKGHKKLFLFCFDSMAHLLWQKEWDKPADFPKMTPFDDWLMADFKPDGHGNYLMLSSIARGPNNQTLLMKLDSNFNEVWHKDFGDNRYNSIAQSLIVENVGYTFGGYYSSLNQTTKGAFYRTELFKTDTAGNLTWHWLSDSTRLTFGAVGLIKTKDGGYIFSGQGAGQKIVYPTTAVVYWWPWIEKIDAVGNSQWNMIVSNHYTIDADYCSINKLIELPDGDIMAAGQIVDGYGLTDTLNGTFGTLVSITASGKIKWKRQYSYLGDKMTYHLYDMKQTSDGGYIMAGQAYDEYHKIPSMLPWQRAWLLKVDSNGCMSNNDPQCWAVSVPEQPVAAKDEYRIYPNPVSSQLQISFSKTSNEDDVFVLNDITGRVLAQTRLTGLSGKATIDMSALQAGMYLYRIMSGTTVKQSGKIIRQ